MFRRSALSSNVMWVGRDTVFLVGLAVIVALVMVGLLAPPAHAFSTFTVNLTADTPDANLSNTACDVNPSAAGNQCTLRAAIQEANDNNNPTEVDRINFNIGGTGVHTISPASGLPFITEPVLINGYSQPGSSANTLAKGTNAKLRIQINGTNCVACRGLLIAASNSVVKGLVINRFLQGGIEVAPDIGADLVTNIRVEGNFLGTDPSGTLDRGNGGGVDLFAVTNTTIGGTSRAARNLISANDFDGIFISGGSGQGSADNNTVQGNLIGTQKDGIHALGNSQDGVGVGFHADGNRILSNSIFSNGGEGIDLGDNGPSANDSGDTDTGSNRLQNFPVLSSAKTISGKTTIEGTLNSRPRELYTLQFFSNPSGNEGRTFIGSKIVSTDASGNATFTFSPTTAVAVGQKITATATRNATGDTSEFSAAREVASS